MNRDDCAKAVYVAWADAKAIPSGVTMDALWTEMSEESKDVYRAAANAVIKTIIGKFDRSVVLLSENKIHPVMTADELAFATKELAKHSNTYRGETEYFPRLLNSAVHKLLMKEKHQIERIKHFQDDLLTYLRALALIATSVGNASTHGEKNARLRGMISLIESAIQSVRSGYDSLLTNYWSEHPDLFRSDYPVREYIQKINELKEENESLKRIASQNTSTDVDPDAPM